MVRRRTLGTIICVILFALLLLLIPFPKHIEKSMAGLVLGRNDEFSEEVEGTISIWELHYLVFPDLYRIELVFDEHMDAVDVINTITLVGYASEKFTVDQTPLLIAPVNPYYFQELDSYVPGGTMIVSDDYSMISIIDFGYQDYREKIIVLSE